MADYQVTCTKKDGADADRRIDALAGPGWKQASIDDVICWIEKEGHTFWVEVAKKRVSVVVRQHDTGRRLKYLTTEADSFPPNNLLKLPDCP
ncbi:MAG: DUF3892 domain-containing protein [Hyphomonadaceae bacterium]